MTTAWFIGRSQWRRRWIGLIGLGVLAGIVAGVVMASIAGIRRTDSALERLIDEGALPGVAVESFSPAVDLDVVADRLRDAPGVEHAVRVVGLVGRDDIDKNWWFVGAPMSDDGSTPVMAAGREPATDAPDEVAISRHTAEKFGLAVGSTFMIDFYSVEQIASISQNSAIEPAGPRPTLEVVGIYLDPRDVERSTTSTAVRGSEAFAAAHVNDTALGLVLVTTTGEAGTAELIDAVAAVERRARPVGGARQRTAGRGPAATGSRCGAGEPYGRRARSRRVRRRRAARWSRRPWAGVAPLAESRRRDAADDHGDGGDSPRAADVARRRRRAARRPRTRRRVLTSWLLSPLFPIGVLRDIEPDPGLHLDGLVTVLGVVSSIVVLVGLVAAVSVLARRGAAERTRRAEHPVIKAVERASAPLPALVGIRYAVRPGRAGVALPVRTTLTAAVVGVSGLVATAIFTSSLTRLESTPVRYGVAWDVSMELLSAPDGQQALDDLVADPRVADVGVTSIAIADVQIDGVRTAVSVLTTIKGDPQMVLGAGRAPQNESEVALGPRLLDEIGKSIGDSVEVTDTDGTTATHTVVGSSYSLESSRPTSTPSRRMSAPTSGRPDSTASRSSSPGSPTASTATKRSPSSTTGIRSP